MTASRDILQMLVILAEQTKETLSQERLAFMVSELQPLGADKVLIALRQMMRSARRFPTISEVQTEMGMGEASAKDEALMVADRIILGLSRFGWLQPGYAGGAEARKLAVGDQAWEMITRQGGWNAALDRLGDNQAAFRAQLRDLAEAYIKTGAIERGAALAPMPSPHQALEKVRASATPQLEPWRDAAKKELEDLKTKRQLLAMQEDHDKEEP